MFDDNGVITEDFRTNELPQLLGDDYYNDPETKQQPTKVFDNLKTKADIAKKIVNAERMISKHGQDLQTKIAEATKGMIKLPGEGASETEIAAYREAIGAGKTVDDYELTIPEGDDGEGFKSIASTIKELALTEGAPKALVSKIWDGVVEKMQADNAALEQAGIKMMKDDIDAQKQEYGEKYNAFVEDVKRVFDKLGKDSVKDGEKPIGQQFQSVLEMFGLLQKDENGSIVGGHPAVMKVMGEIAPLVLEGGTVLGGSDGTPAEDWPSNYEYDDAGKPK